MTQEKRENFMFTKDTIFYKKLLGLMLPMMLQNLMLALVAVADAFMLGGMDQNYMSAVSLATATSASIKFCSIIGSIRLQSFL